MHSATLEPSSDPPVKHPRAKRLGEKRSMSNLTDPNVGGIDPLKALPPRGPHPAAETEVGENKVFIDKLARKEVDLIEEKVAEAHEDPQDGSDLETARELHKVAEIVQSRADTLKQKADNAFLSQQRVAETADEPEGINGVKPTTVSDDLGNKKLSSGVKEQIVELEMIMASIDAAPSSDPSDVADKIDQIAQALKTKAADINKAKIEKAASELNDLDGFNR